MLECDWMRSAIGFQWSGWRKWGGSFWVVDGVCSCVGVLSGWKGFQ